MRRAGLILIGALTSACVEDIVTVRPDSGPRRPTSSDAGDAAPRLDASEADGGDAGVADATPVGMDATAPPPDTGPRDGGARTDAGGYCPGLRPRTAGFRLSRTGDGSLTSGVATGAGRVAYVWEDVVRREVWMTILNLDGTTRSAPRVISTSAYSPQIVFADGDFAVVYHDLAIGDIAFRRYDRDGNQVVLVRLAQSVMSTAGYPKIAFLGDKFGVAYMNGSDASGFKVYFARLRFDGIRVEQFRVLPGTTMTTALPDVAAAGDGFAVVWTDERAGGNRIYAARIDGNGLKLTPPGDIPISDGTERALFPTVAANGRALEICWDVTDAGGHSTKIWCNNLGADDRVGTPVRMVDGTATTSLPKVTWTGERFIAAWAGEELGIGQVFGRVLHPSGQPDGPLIRFTEIPGTSAYPALVWVGTGLELGWFQYSAASGWEYDHLLYRCDD